jgi:hypothetical protein
MTQMRSGPWSAPLVHLALVALLLSVVSPLWAPRAAEAQGDAIRVLLFGPEDASGKAPVGLAGQLTDATMLTMRRARLYQPFAFSPVDPSVLRALDEGKLTAEDLEAALDARTAVKIGSALGADVVMLTKIDDYSAVADPASVTVTFSGVMYPVAQNVDPQTRAPKDELTGAQTFGVQGASAPRVGYRGDLGPLQAEAVEDAIAKAKEVLTGEPAAPKAPAVKKKRTVPDWALWLIGAGILVALINSGGGDGAAAGDLPGNTRLSSDGTNVLLQWDPPTDPREQIVAYRIYRRASTEAAFRQVAEVTGDEINYSDYDIQEGVAYTYQISVVYQTIGETQRVTFQTITVPSAQT